jgi:tetratricopeptide (TPR) repeat protein
LKNKANTVVIFIWVAVLSNSIVVIHAQTTILDSLKTALQKATNDTSRCKILNSLIEVETDESIWPKYNEVYKNLCEINLANLNRSKPEYKIFKTHLSLAISNFGLLEKNKKNYKSSLLLYGKSLAIMKEIKFKEGISMALSNMSNIFKEQGNITGALQILNEQTENRNEDGIGDALNDVGSIYFDKGDLQKSEEYMKKALIVRKRIKDKIGLATSLGNLATIHEKKGDISQALNFHHQSLKEFEAINHSMGMAGCLINIGIIYKNQSDWIKAKDYYLKGLSIYKLINNKKGIASAFHSIGLISMDKNDYVEAQLYLTKALELRKSLKDEANYATTLIGLGMLMYKKQDYDKSLSCFFEALKIKQKYNNKEGEAWTLNNISGIYLEMKNYGSALNYCQQGFVISSEIGYPMNIRNSSLMLNKIYKAIGNHKLALENYELYIKMRDSINNESTRKASIKSQLKYEYEKQAAKDSVAHAKETEIANAELAKQKAEIKAKKNQQYALFGGLGLVVVFAGFMYNRFKITKKQKVIIEEKEKETQKQNETISRQKHLVEEKQKEILDSIYYARRIQTALITNEKSITKTLRKIKNE